MKHKHGQRRPQATDGARRSHIYRRPGGRSSQTGDRGGSAEGRQTCPIKRECGSCRHVNEDYAAQLQTKFEAELGRLHELTSLGKIPTLGPVPAPRPLGYRCHIKLVVRSRKAPADPRAVAKEHAEGRFAMGLFHPGSHQVVDVDVCPLHTPALQALLPDLRAELEESDLTPYDEASHSGELRAVAARSGHLTGEILLTFVTTAPQTAALKRIVQQLRRRGHKINAAHENVNPEQTNAIFGPQTTRLAGADRLRERIGDLDFEISPTAFFQVNPWQAENLYRRVEQLAGPGSGGVAWDLYCGAGPIAMVLAREGYRVLGVEEIPEATQDAERNARKNGLQENAEFLAQKMEAADSGFPTWARDPGLIVANPSRRGLAEATRALITKTMQANPRVRFLYVSCSVETLGRDLEHLREHGLTVRQLEAFDMFPQTEKLEWLAVVTP